MRPDINKKGLSLFHQNQAAVIMQNLYPAVKFIITLHNTLNWNQFLIVSMDR